MKTENRMHCAGNWGMLLDEIVYYSVEPKYPAVLPEKTVNILFQNGQWGYIQVDPDNLQKFIDAFYNPPRLA